MVTDIKRRRIVFLVLNLLSMTFFALLMLLLIVSGGMTISESLIGLGFILTMPYMVLGFWNAAVGVWLRHGHADVIRAMPGVFELQAQATPKSLDCDIVVLMTLRNEAPQPIFERLTRMRDSLAGTGQLARFTFAILSDSNKAEVIDAEARAFRKFAGQSRPEEPTSIYRRRDDNHGYKAGNILDFLDHRGRSYDYFMPLDSDSLMSGEVMVRLVATVQSHPEIGILQSLAVGMPSNSGFARVFQFGMRHAMRAFTTGAAWWTADCGSYWGHNAVIRVAPFLEHCRLPELPGSPPLGGSVLSHDQLEAAFMRRGGYETRVIPVESESYEINPPTLLDFIRRELRWCQGNMQYLRLLGTPGLKPVSRIQLLIAIGMYAAQAAWIGMIAVGCVGALIGDFSGGSFVLGISLFMAVFLFSISPKIFGAIDIFLTPGGVRRYGGGGLFVLSVIAELLSSIFMAPIVAVSVSLFIMGLVFGKSVTWSGQNRDQLDLAWHDAFRALAPHTLAGLLLAFGLWWVGGYTAVLWGLPIIVGLALAAPYTWLGANATIGRLLVRARLFAIPEERHTPVILIPRRAD